jgi:hypothetical protein
MFHDTIVKAWIVLTQNDRKSTPASRRRRASRQFVPQLGSTRLEARLVLSTIGGGAIVEPAPVDPGDVPVDPGPMPQF